MGKSIRVALLLVIMGFILFGKTGRDIVVLASMKGNTSELSTDQICSQIYLEATVNQAIGTQNQLVLYNNTLMEGTYSLRWSSTNPTVAMVDIESGIIDALSLGSTTLTCVLRVGESQYKYSCIVTVTDPQFSQITYYVKKNSQIVLPIKGSSTTEFICMSSNDTIVSPLGKGSMVVGKSAGTAWVTVEVDRRYISCYVIVSEPKVNVQNLYLAVKKTATLKITGHSKTTPIVFSSSNKAVATVNSKGYIKAIKNGSATIKIKVDDSTYYCYVAVGKTSIVNALKRANAALGSKYSQKLRMKKGYYDCSSLVWRTYSPSGYRFGQKTYAPTAAAQAKQLVKEKKVISYKGIDQSKLLPGDLIFLKATYNSKRYKNITHVAIYIGNGRILHARDEKAGVCIDNYDTYKKRIVVIGRL